MFNIPKAVIDLLSKKDFEIEIPVVEGHIELENGSILSLTATSVTVKVVEKSDPTKIRYELTPNLTLKHTQDFPGFTDISHKHFVPKEDS